MSNPHYRKPSEGSNILTQPRAEVLEAVEGPRHDLERWGRGTVGRWDWRPLVLLAAQTLPSEHVFKKTSGKKTHTTKCCRL